MKDIVYNRLTSNFLYNLGVYRENDFWKSSYFFDHSHWRTKSCTIGKIKYHRLLNLNKLIFDLEIFLIFRNLWHFLKKCRARMADFQKFYISAKTKNWETTSYDKCSLSNMTHTRSFRWSGSGGFLYKIWSCYLMYHKEVFLMYLKEVSIWCISERYLFM